MRAFEERDYPRLAAIGAAIDPDERHDVAWFRRRDDTWDPQLLRQRLVVERDQQVVGWGEVGHMWWAPHPRKFVLRLNVDPAYQSQGIGSQLYARLLDTLLTWNPIALRTDTGEDRTRCVAFLVHRGFAEYSRRWQSRLTLTEAHVEHAPEVDARLKRQGITIVTLAEELARRGEALVHELYALEQLASRDQPGFDADAADVPFAQFVAHELGSDALNDGSFLALDGQRLVGVSRLGRDSAGPRILHVGFTGVDPAYRGRSIGVGLKLRTIAYGRANGFDEIRTENDTTNVPMLHINAVLGFRQGLPWLVFEKRFA